MSDDLTELTAQVRSRIEALGYELADFRKGGATGRPLLQVRIDRPGAEAGVTVDDCARASRALEEWLDGAGTMGPRYILEVSSPGIERPVRWREHWVRFTGQDVIVRLRGRGRIRATIVRVVDGTDDVVLRPVGSVEEVTVPLSEARDARLAVDWK